MSDQVIKICIAEDNPGLRQQLLDRLARYTHIHILATYKNGNEIVAGLTGATTLPDVVLMDIEMDGMDGIIATGKLKDIYPDLKILILTVFDDDNKVFNAIKAGASGYLLKEEKIENIVQAIDEVNKGLAYMSPIIARKTMEFLKINLPSKQSEVKETGDLTKRELEILQCINEGLTYNTIAEQLYISPETVKTHVKNIFDKLQVKNKVQALRIASSKKWL
jgi:DNA-binding NarL/FixJ family response regulator